MDKVDLKGWMEFTCVLSNYQLEASLPDLLEAIEATAIHSFGWPIAPVRHTPDSKPKPQEDGIVSIIRTQSTFDYWTLAKNGNFYILKSLFEDARKAGKIFVDTRIIRTAELLVRTAHLYRRLGVPGEESLSMRIVYGGLEGRQLSASDGRWTLRSDDRRCHVRERTFVFEATVSSMLQPDHLQSHVQNVVQNLTEVFDFYKLAREKLTNPLVEKFFKDSGLSSRN